MSTIPVFGVGCAIGSLFGPEFCPAGGAIGEGLLVAYTAYEEFENQVVKSNSEGVCPLKK
jgi:hypothetical protein